MGRVIFTFCMSTSSITEDIRFNIGVNRTAIVLITAGNIIFINKIMRNGIDFLSRILFGRERKWGQCNARSEQQFTVGTKYKKSPHYNEPSHKKQQSKS